MASIDQIREIYRKIEQGQISSEEGVRQIKALERGESGATGTKPEGSRKRRNKKSRWVRIQVSEINSDREKINIRLPVNVVDTGFQMGARFVPNGFDVDINRLIRAIKKGEPGTIIETGNRQSSERVIITLE
ncbi:MAG: hypothetical protein GYA15_10960 [Leptolinea sp.]|jgi:hypothetical protein|nr:hypothetical protein [Leptolinea sp.]